MKAVILNFILCGFFATATCLYAGDKKTPEKLENKVVDSGTFGLYVGGKRIGSETFKIEQRADFSIATAELKVDDGNVHAAQSAEMRVSPTGDLRSYIWKSTSPQIEESSVEPQDNLLMEHLTPADQKKKDVPHLLPASTAVLDNNFFSQREVLLWRYLATGCHKQNDNLMCAPSSFSVLVPQLHQSASAVIELLGTDKVTVKGSERMLNKVKLTVGDPKQMVMMSGQSDSEPGQWLLWVDDQYKIIKITAFGSNFEAVRE